STCCETGAIFSCTLRTVIRLDRTINTNVDLLKPLDSTVTVYSPIGTARKENWPAPSVWLVCEKADERESSVIFAAAIGRCCGSSTVPLTSPNTEADALDVKSKRITKPKRM